MNHRVLRDFFPAPQQEPLLEAAFLRTPGAALAWQEWSSRIDWINDHPDCFALLPFVYKNLSRLRVRGPLMSKLKGVYRYTWSKNIQDLRKHVDLLRFFHDTGVRVLLLDDAALSVGHQPEAGVYRVSGLDVLVPLHDAKRVLASLAFRGWYPERAQTRRLLWLGHSTRMIGGSDRSFHLHWHAIPGCVSPAADEPFWDQAVPAELLGVPILVLSSADSLLRAITRGIGPNPAPPMRWVTAAAAIVDSAGENMQWDRLPAMAHGLGIGLRLEHGLQYLHKTLRQDRIKGVLEELDGLSPSTVERLEYRFMKYDAGQRHRPAFNRYRAGMVRYLRHASDPGWRNKRRAPAVPGS